MIFMVIVKRVISQLRNNHITYAKINCMDILQAISYKTYKMKY